MKKILFYIIISFSFIACEDILVEKPKMIATETFYTSADEIEAAIIPIYYQLQRGLRKNYHNIPESMVDYLYARGSYLPVHRFQGLDITNINRLSDIWIRIYRAIRDANLVIQNAPKSEQATKEEIDRFVAEARFLRAFCYFQLARTWGAVPLRTEHNMIDLAVPREPVNNLYDFIIDDLLFAEINLPDIPKMMGRPIKISAKALLTEVYLTIGNWAGARSKSYDIINSQMFSLVPVSKSDDFYNIFGPKINGSSEEVWYLKYNQDYGSEFACMGHHPSYPYLNGRGHWGHYTDSVKNKVISEWDPNDLRKAFNLYHYNGYILGSSTTMFLKKFIDMETTNNYAATDNPFYRYADVLLFFAEADCRINNGPTNDGVEKLNMVRRRAYGFNPNDPSPVDYVATDYDEDSFIDLVLKERGYETFYEGKRYFDLKRVGKFAEIIKDVHGVDINPSILLYAIPNHEIEYNEAIDETDQNPGY